MENSSTKDKIIELGKTFMQTFGYHSFKYQQIASALTIKNAAIHHYFPAKEDLGLAIIEKSHSDFINRANDLLQLRADEKINVLVEIYRDYVSKELNMCMMGVCISGYSELSLKMQEAAKKYHKTIINWLSVVFADGRIKGDFAFDGSSEDLAKLWLNSIAGSIQMAKMNGADDFEKSLIRLQALYLTKVSTK